MANTIPTLQNDEISLRALAAQRRRYGWAKLVTFTQIVLVVLLPAALVVAERKWPNLKITAAVFGLVVALLDAAFLSRLKSSLQSSAATLQEYFDCHVLQLPWPTIKAQRPDVEDLEKSPGPAERPHLLNWYPPAIATLPLHAARVVCQRSNCRWDAQLRRYFRRMLTIGTVGLIAIPLLVATYRNWHFQDVVLALLVPIMPILLWAMREIHDQFEAAERADRLKAFGDNLWTGVLAGISPDEATTQSRSFQEELFEHRRHSPVLFDWIYWLFRSQSESRMAYSAESMVREAQEKGL
jgi:hypothetical protein